MSAVETAVDFRRRRSVELMQQGESKEVISRILGVSRVSLNVWLKKAKAGESLKTKFGHGRPRRLKPQQLAELELLLKQGATAHGWETIYGHHRVLEKSSRNILGLSLAASKYGTF